MTEKKVDNLNGEQALSKIKEIAEEQQTCFFCTNINTGIPMSARPMTVLEVDDHGYLWFMTSKSSYKEDELNNNPLVHLLFQSGKRSGFMNLYGIAELVEDQLKIETLWNPALEIWFDGPDDPQIGLIRVEVLEGHYWDNASAAPIAAFKMLKSLLTGEPDHDGIQGDLNV